MDFTFTPEQDDAAALAARILADATTTDRLKAVEAAGDRLDRDLWRALGEAGLLSLQLPEEHGGAGLGLIELARVLVEAGRRVAPVPLAVHGAASLLLAEAGTPEQQAAWLPAAASGEAVLTAAVAEERSHLPARPVTVARVAGEGHALHGAKALVRAGATASAALVTATVEGTEGGVGVFLLDLGADGVERTPQRTSDGDVVVRLDLTGAPATLVGAADGVAATRLGQLLTLTTAAELLGVTEGALALTAGYARTREQFGRPIGTFQAVSQRLADGYIDVLGQRLTLWSAVWRLTEGLPAEVEVATAKLWAADAAHRLAHTTVHVHGGVGIDLDGEAHRYFTAAKRFEFAWGSATEQALAIGRVLAAEPA
ncbi:acyl-CoA/acyl-ACP dehydrogenase [Nocardioides sp. TRM66260-LWL]|uniref:acyl-CoA dehydrogenase family protein n=1 Tax=Nocardioides sp. TRM66260-LWL TaxID=2874478 RepID=UPI001CC5A814|nr:acyl-CoA dehydrogenase family protein [Nocardioides sp. TRM66260-LWL]MBZ5736230.1 acyl-CoA/acyl-ACP dehydrogenase [Nocardioides sp. TRM66260-LWL]